jgi:uncharacterized membrane protein YccC
MTILSQAAPKSDRQSKQTAAASVDPQPSVTAVSAVPRGKHTGWDVAYSLNMGIACLVTYWITTGLLGPLVDKDSDFLGGMWAVAAAIFGFRDTSDKALRAGWERLVATSVSFALCLAYLLVFPFTPVGLAVLLVIGTLGVTALGQRGDIVTTGITTAVVMVVAGISPQNAWQQPVLRLIDTVVGIALGVTFKFVASYLFRPGTGWRVRA